MITGLVDKVDTEVMEGMNASRRRENRPESVYNLYPDQEDVDLIERRLTAPLPAELEAHRILAKCLELRLALRQ